MSWHLLASRGVTVVGMDESEGQAGKQTGARANREGKPWQRKDGRWTVRVYPPEDSIDRKPLQVYGKTRRDVLAKRDTMAGKLAKGLPSDPDQTIGDYFRRWLYVTLPQYVAAGEIAQSTMDSYRDNAELHIVPDAEPTLRHVKLAELSGPMVRDWQDRLLRKPSGRRGHDAVLSNRTVAYCRAILHKALADAIRDDAAGLEKNAVDKVKPPKRRQNVGKTHCKRGHEFTEENTYVRFDGSRECRTCSREREEERRRMKRRVA